MRRNAVEPPTQGVLPCALLLAFAYAGEAAQAQVERRGTLCPAVRELVRSRAPAASSFVIDADARGYVRRVRGELPCAGADVASRALDVCTKYAAWFGADASTRFAAPEVRARFSGGVERDLFVPQSWDGRSAEDLGIFVRFDREGRAQLAQGVLWSGAAGTPGFSITDGQASALAMAYLETQGLRAGDLAAPLAMRATVRLSPRGPRTVFDVRAVRARDLASLRLVLDAGNGALIEAGDDTYRGEGSFHNGGNTHHFATGAARGTAFRSAARARAQAFSSVVLPEVAITTAVPGVAERGMLFGRFAHVIDRFHGSPFTLQSASLDFRVPTILRTPRRSSCKAERRHCA